MAKRRISLCLLTFNELKGCQQDVPHIPREGFHEIFCVDGNSKDGTAEYMKSQNIPVYTQPKKGISAGYVHAVEKASSDAIIVFFPKGTLPVALIQDIKKTLEDGSEFVVASRNIAGAVNEEDAYFFKPRKWFVQLLGFIVALIRKREGVYITDVLHGVKGFGRQNFLYMNIEDEGHAVDLAMAIRSYKLRTSRSEVPAQENPRIYGETHFKAIPTGLHLLGFLMREILGMNPGQRLPGARV